MAYFDNAATTFPKPECVYECMDIFYRQNGGSAGRGKYNLAKSVGEMVSETRNLITDILMCPAKQVIFTPTATIALNILIQGIVKKGIKNVFISPFEHNAVTRTLYAFEKEGLIRVQQLIVSEKLEYEIERIRYQFDATKPDLVIISHASNTIGHIAPIEDIFKCAKKYGALTIVDLAQSAGLVEVNCGAEYIDFAVFAGHKTLYGPTGISGFVMKPDIKLPTVLFGGTGYESANQDMPEDIPERYEMGTMNIVGLAGLNAALKWIKTETIEKLHQREIDNRNRLLSLLEKYEFINIVGNYENRDYVGIVSCLINGISSDSAGGVFNEQGISVRTGLHCAPLAHRFLNTYPSGTIRFSVGYYTSDEDFKQLENALDFIADNI